MQKCANLVDLEKCCKMTIWWPRSVLIPPRTSLGMSDVSWLRGGACADGAPELRGTLRSSPRHITLSEARSRLYQRRSLQVNSHFSAFFKIYKIFTILRRSNLNFFLQNFVKKFVILKKFSQNLNFAKI